MSDDACDLCDEPVVALADGFRFCKRHSQGAPAEVVRPELRTLRAEVTAARRRAQNSADYLVHVRVEVEHAEDCISDLKVLVRRLVAAITKDEATYFQLQNTELMDALAAAKAAGF